jgi:peptidoglycan-N-acetylglucosamine deacetylase
MLPNPIQLRRFIKRLTGAVTHIEGGAKRSSILFTFDDGPHPVVTPKVLALLDRYKARAVFFVVGNRIERAPNLLQSILDRGHALGNHSFSHFNGQPLPLPAYLADIRRCQEAIAAVTGSEPRLFRPPLGRVSLSSVYAARLLGLRTILWSVDTQDWRLRDDETARARAREVAVDSFPPASGKKNDIVLMHDDNLCSVTLLQELLPLVASLGCDISSPLDQIF